MHIIYNQSQKYWTTQTYSSVIFSAPIFNVDSQSSGKDSTCECNIESRGGKSTFHFETEVLDTVTILSLNRQSIKQTKNKKQKFLNSSAVNVWMELKREAVQRLLVLIVDLYCYHLFVFICIVLYFLNANSNILISGWEMFIIYNCLFCFVFNTHCSILSFAIICEHKKENIHTSGYKIIL